MNDDSKNTLGDDCILVPIGEQGLIGEQGPVGSNGEHIESLTINEDGLSKGISTPVMVIDSDDGEGATRQSKDVDEAFGVKPFHWKNAELAPFAIDREGDWQRHREIMGDPQLHEIIRQPQSMVIDALRVLWFCAHEPKEWICIPSMVLDDDGNWTRRTAQERALVIEEKIRAWSRENVANHEQALAVSLFYDIYQSAQKTRAVPKPSEHSNEQRSKN